MVTERYTRRVILIVVFLASFITPFLGASVNVALPRIGEEFSMSALSLGWVAMAFLLSSAVFMVPFGKVADIVGRKKVFLAGNIIITVSFVLCAVATSGAMLIFFRAIQGVGCAMTFGTGVAIITSAFPPGERGKAIGITATSTYLGLSLAPFLGGVLTHALGWRSLFLVSLPLGVLVVCLTAFAVREEWAEARNEKFDFRGSAIYMVAISMFMYGISKLPDPSAIALSVAGFAGLVVFVRTQTKVAHPVLNVRLFTENRLFGFANLAAFINYAATFAVSFMLSLYLQYIKGLNPLEAGLILLAQPLLMTFFSPVAGHWSDRHDPRLPASAGMAVVTAGLVMLAFLTPGTSNVYIIASLVVLGTGFGMFSSPNTNSVMGSVDKRLLGVASATVSTMRLTGQMTSMGVATLIIHIFIGKAPVTPANHHLFMDSATLVFALFSVLCFAGVFISMARGKKER